jgi:glycosyltransferase involved in cell wall biosynthesis
MSKGMEPLVSVVIPTRSRTTHLVACLNSVFGSSYSNLEVIVVDDFSQNPPGAEVHRLFPQVTLLRNESRMLLAASRNRGLGASKGEFVLFVDDDNILDRRAIEELVRGAHDTSADVVAPIIYYASEPDLVCYAGS